MIAAQSDWLVQEVLDLVDAGPVGLYEFIWILRGAHPSMSLADMQSCASDALSTLVTRHSARLVWLIWPSVPVEDPADPPARKVWSDPEPGVPYPAVSCD